MSKNQSIESQLEINASKLSRKSTSRRASTSCDQIEPEPEESVNREPEISEKQQNISTHSAESTRNTPSSLINNSSGIIVKTTQISAISQNNSAIVVTETAEPAQPQDEISELSSKASSKANSQAGDLSLSQKESTLIPEQLQPPQSSITSLPISTMPRCRVLSPQTPQFPRKEQGAQGTGQHEARSCYSDFRGSSSNIEDESGGLQEKGKRAVSEQIQTCELARSMQSQSSESERFQPPEGVSTTGGQQEYAHRGAQSCISDAGSHGSTSTASELRRTKNARQFRSQEIATAEPQSSLRSEGSARCISQQMALSAKSQANSQLKSEIPEQAFKKQQLTDVQAQKCLQIIDLTNVKVKQLNRQKLQLMSRANNTSDEPQKQLIQATIGEIARTVDLLELEIERLEASQRGFSEDALFCSIFGIAKDLCRE